MMLFEMFGTVALPVPVKNWLSIPLRETYLLSKFGKLSSLTSRNMTDKHDHVHIMLSTPAEDCF